MCIHGCICMSAYMYVCIYVCLHICMSAYVYVCIYVCTLPRLYHCMGTLKTLTYIVSYQPPLLLGLLGESPPNASDLLYHLFLGLHAPDCLSCGLNFHAKDHLYSDLQKACVSHHTWIHGAPLQHDDDHSILVRAIYVATSFFPHGPVIMTVNVLTPEYLYSCREESCLSPFLQEDTL